MNPSLDPKVKIDEKRVRHAVENEFARTVRHPLPPHTPSPDARAAIKVSKQVGSLLGDIRELNEDQIRLQIDDSEISPPSSAAHRHQRKTFTLQ